MAQHASRFVDTIRKNLSFAGESLTRASKRTAMRIAAAAMGVFLTVVVLCCVGMAIQEPRLHVSAGEWDELLPAVDQVYETASFSPSIEALESAQFAEGLATFCLSEGEAPVLDDDRFAAIEKAVSDVEDHGEVSVVFYDLGSGKGISVNPDTEIYGASTFKAPYALYVLQTFVDTGELDLSDECSVWQPLGYSGFYSATLGGCSVRDLCSAMIIYSDNDAFASLREAYDAPEFDEWVCSLGVPEAMRSDLSYYPTYSARSSAQLWTQMHAYFLEGSDNAQWLKDLTAQTELSFIRDGVQGQGALVCNKGGWCADYDPAYNSSSDAGIIECDGRSYIMSIMTSQPACDESFERVSNLASALFEAREALA